MSKLNKIIFGLIAVALILGGVGLFLPKLSPQPRDDSAGAAGDVDRIKKVHQLGLTAGTNVPCAILNPSGGRARYIEKVYAYGQAANLENIIRKTELGLLSVATSSSATATTTGVRYLVDDVATSVFTASTTEGAFYASTTPSNASAINIWGAGDYLLFIVGESIGVNATTSSTLTGYCGAEYYTQM